MSSFASLVASAAASARAQSQPNNENNNNNNNNNNDTESLNHCTNDGTDVILPNNRNPSSKDSANPYAYPYCHSDFCLLYDLVLQFPSTLAKTSRSDGNGGGSGRGVVAQNANENGGNEEEDEVEDPTVLQRHLVRRIETRCWTHPEELAWKDSCGDTALHRLAQMARLHHDQRSAHFLLRIAKIIVDTDSETVTAQNNWRETPLHQFVAHSGLPHHLPSCQAAADAADDSVAITAVVDSKKKSPMIQFAELLCQSRAASLPNYQGIYPLHDAVALPLVPKGQLLMSTSSAQRQHAAVVDIVAAAAPFAMTVSSRGGAYPWMQALHTANSSPRVLELLLERDILSTSVQQQKMFTDKLATQLRESYSALSAPSPSDIIHSVLEDWDGSEKERILSPLPAHVKCLWEKTTIATSRLSSRLLHGLVLAKAPASAIALAVALEPQQLTEKLESMTLNGNGALVSGMGQQLYPLDLVLRLPPARGSSEREKFRVRDILNCFLDAQPSLASISTTALHTAVSHRLYNQLTWSGGLLRLFQAYPQAVSMKDERTGLYPFQLASAASGASENNVETTTIVFELLRADPSIVAP